MNPPKKIRKYHSVVQGIFAMDSDEFGVLGIALVFGIIFATAREQP